MRRASFQLMPNPLMDTEIVVALVLLTVVAVAGPYIGFRIARARMRAKARDRKNRYPVDLDLRSGARQEQMSGATDFPDALLQRQPASPRVRIRPQEEAERSDPRRAGFVPPPPPSPDVLTGKQVSAAAAPAETKPAAPSPTPERSKGWFGPIPKQARDTLRRLEYDSPEKMAHLTDTEVRRLSAQVNVSEEVIRNAWMPAAAAELARRSRPI